MKTQTPNSNGWKPVDVIVLVMTTTICLGIAGSFLAPLFPHVSTIPEMSETMSVVFASLINIVAGFVGARIQHYKKEENEENK